MNFDYIDVENFGKIDLSKQQRTGIPEVILCSGKSSEQILKICNRYFGFSDSVILTKCAPKTFKLLSKSFSKIEYNREAKVLVIRKIKSKKEKIGSVVIAAAGTADFPVAEEARIICEEFGLEARMHVDVGVSGIHRLAPLMEDLKKREPDMLIVVAGMEAALPTFLAGLLKVPIIAVPTSVGYGKGLKGLAAFLSMANSCAPGISVVNIDNGFGAAAFAYKAIANIREKNKLEIPNKV